MFFKYCCYASNALHKIVCTKNKPEQAKKSMSATIAQKFNIYPSDPYNNLTDVHSPLRRQTFTKNIFLKKIIIMPG